MWRIQLTCLLPSYDLIGRGRGYFYYLRNPYSIHSISYNGRNANNVNRKLWLSYCSSQFLLGKRRNSCPALKTDTTARFTHWKFVLVVTFSVIWGLTFVVDESSLRKEHEFVQSECGLWFTLNRKEQGQRWSCSRLRSLKITTWWACEVMRWDTNTT
jgi:hypothetical protein